jgi:hypothetical protein
MYQRIINLIQKYKYDNIKIPYLISKLDYLLNYGYIKIKDIRKNPNNFNWWVICSCNSRLPEKFIKEFQDKVDWVNVCYYQTLSEDFIREFKDKLAWVDVCSKQKLSKEFIIEFIDYIDFECILTNKNISDDVKDYCRMFI